MKIYLSAIFLFSILLSYSQYTDTATMTIIENARAANEGDLYLDTNAKEYRIGLTHGLMGKITDDQNIDSVTIVGDSLYIYLENSKKGAVNIANIGGNNSVVPAIGDVKFSFQSTDHDGWYLINGRTVSSLPITAQTNASSLGFVGNIPNANNRVFKHPTGGQIPGNTGGQATTTLTQGNLPNYNLPTTNTSTNGNHNHTGTTNNVGNHDHTGTTSTDGSHNHNIPNLRLVNGALGGLFSSNGDYYTSGGTTSTNDAGNHNHSLNIANAGNHTHTVNTNNNGNHNHSVTVSSGGSNESFDRY